MHILEEIYQLIIFGDYERDNQPENIFGNKERKRKMKRKILLIALAFCLFALAFSAISGHFDLQKTLNAEPSTKFNPDPEHVKQLLFEAIAIEKEKETNGNPLQKEN